jgi:conjugal transfer pilus assembly protein TrbC
MFKAKVLLLIAIILATCQVVVADKCRNKEILIFVSFSMPDKALQDYYLSAQKYKARLIIRGLKNNSFQETQKKIKDLRINIDIDPNLFAEYQISKVPTIVVVEQERAKKVTGHISLAKALEVMEYNAKSNSKYDSS